MSIGSGLAGSFGIATETTYGTGVPVTRFVEVAKAEVKKVKNTVQGGGMAAGRMAQLASRRVVTTEAGSGSDDLEVPNKGWGLFLQHIMGGTAVPVQQGATAAYLQTHPLVDNVGKSFTAQVGIPDTTGVVRPQTGKGGKITKAEFTCGVDELLMCSLDVDYQKYSEAEVLAAPSYPTGVMPFNFSQMSLRLGATSGSEAAVAGVKKVTLTLERGQATDRFYAGATTAGLPGLKAEPLMNEWVKVSGSIDADFVDKTIFSDRFRDDTQTALVWDFTGPLIAGTYYQRITFRVPAVFYDGDSQTLEGADITSGTFPFVAQLDGSNPLATVEYCSTDSAA